MDVNDIIETRFVWYNGLQNAINVLHAKVTVKVGTGATLTQCAMALRAAVIANMKGLADNRWVYKGIKYRQVAPVATADSIDTTSTGAGSLAGDSLPPQICGLLTLRAATAPPRVRGRVYLPSPTEASNDVTGMPTAAYVNLMNLTATDLQNPVTAGGGGNTNTLAWAITHGRVPATMTSFPITTANARTTWATQRRRSQINRSDIPAI